MSLPWICGLSRHKSTLRVVHNRAVDRHATDRRSPKRSSTPGASPAVTPSMADATNEYSSDSNGVPLYDGVEHQLNFFVAEQVSARCLDDDTEPALYTKPEFLRSFAGDLVVPKEPVAILLSLSATATSSPISKRPACSVISVPLFARSTMSRSCQAMVIVRCTRPVDTDEREHEFERPFLTLLDNCCSSGCEIEPKYARMRTFTSELSRIIERRTGIISRKR
jgi:hypothetical protein